MEPLLLLPKAALKIQNSAWKLPPTLPLIKYWIIPIIKLNTAPVLMEFVLLHRLLRNQPVTLHGVKNMTAFQPTSMMEFKGLIFLIKTASTNFTEPEPHIQIP